jgi:hypothetical protein
MIGTLTILVSATLVSATWVETSQSDFRDGTYEHNIYASWRDGGAIEFTYRFDLNNDTYIDLLVSDLASRVTYIYWGSDSGYSTANRTSYPNPDAANCFGADLDCDSYAEFVANSRGGGQITIYAGTPMGPSPTQVTLLPTPDRFCAGMLAADFDKNGYLDITCGGYENAQCSYIYWGDSSGYSTGRRTELPGDQPCHNPEAEDFNKDGWLDFLQSNDVNPQHIYWGSPTGFSQSNRTELVSPGNPRHHGKSTADLNGDGWLDLVFTTEGGSECWIYWGSRSGFSGPTVLNPGRCGAGSSVSDMNSNGYLDIVFGVNSSRDKPRIYWGSDSGYSDAASTVFGEPSNYRGMFVADLNGDSAYDVFLNDKDGDSPIYWGPHFVLREDLPTSEDCAVMSVECDNSYDRSRHEDYLSSVFNAGVETTWQTISWDDTAPGNSSVELAVRTGNTAVPDPGWTGWVTVGNGSLIPDSLASQYVQYQATFRYETPAVLPTLFEVRINYDRFALDVSADSIIRPAGTVDSGTVIVPLAIVRNRGDEEATFPTTMRIGTSYAETVDITLPAHTPDTIQFPPWTAQPVGVLPTVCYTALTGDENRANDTVHGSVTVAAPAGPDVGVIEIVDPIGAVDSGAVRIPRAVVGNFGEEEADFPVTMRVGSSYTETVQKTMAPGETDTVSFAAWIATPIGSLPVVCYTGLAGDTDRSNDTATATRSTTSAPPGFWNPDSSLSPARKWNPGP